MREAVTEERRDAVAGAAPRPPCRRRRTSSKPGTAGESAEHIGAARISGRPARCGAARDHRSHPPRPRRRADPLSRFHVPASRSGQLPWRSQAAWLYSQMLRWDHIPYSAADAATAAAVFRPDIYRAALAGSGAPLPAPVRSSKAASASPSAPGRYRAGSSLAATAFSMGAPSIPTIFRDILLILLNVSGVPEFMLHLRNNRLRDTPRDQAVLDVTRQGCRGSIKRLRLQRRGRSARQVGSLFPALQQAMKPSGCARVAAVLAAFFFARRTRGRTMTTVCRLARSAAANRISGQAGTGRRWSPRSSISTSPSWCWVILGPLAPAISDRPGPRPRRRRG